MEQVEQMERFPVPDQVARLESETIDLRFEVPVIDLRTDPVDLDLDFGPDPILAGLRGNDVVIDLRDDSSPMVVLGDREPMTLFAEGAPAGATDTEATDLSLPTVGMWARPDRCLPMLVNLARFRQGGISAVSSERTDLTELAVLASLRGDVDARRLARLARGCR